MWDEELTEQQLDESRRNTGLYQARSFFKDKSPTVDEYFDFAERVYNYLKNA